MRKKTKLRLIFHLSFLISWYAAISMWLETFRIADQRIFPAPTEVRALAFSLSIVVTALAAIVTFSVVKGEQWGWE